MCKHYKVLRQKQRFYLSEGFTLVELMIVIAIIGVIAAMAVPVFSGYVAKTRVKNATEEIFGLVMQAKSEGPIRDSNVFINTSPAASPWCVGYALSTGCDCTNTTSCVVNVAGSDVLQVVNGAGYKNVTIAETFSGTGSQFNKLRGTVPPGSNGTISVVSGAWQLDIVISTAGRVRICNPNSNPMLGYDKC